MVSFICDACQETVKKNKVDNHYQFKCKDCWSLSCVDCGVVFEGDAYKEHNTCISEAEKYQGALYQEPKKKGGKQDPQARWVDLIERLAADTSVELSQGCRSILEKLAGNANVPRKEKKFFNYINSALHIHPNDPLGREVYDALQKQWIAEKDTSDSQTAQQETKKEEPEAENDSSNNKRKRPDDVPKEDGEDKKAKKAKKEKKDKKEDSKEAWEKAVKKALKKADDKSLKLKQLVAALEAKGLKLEKKQLKSFLKSKPERFGFDKSTKLVKLV